MSDFYNVVDIDAQGKPTQAKLFAAILIEKNICCNSPKSDKFVIIEKFYQAIFRQGIVYLYL